MAKRLECSPLARETRVQSPVESYQRLKKWYLMPPYLTLSIIRYGSRVNWSNPGKGVAPSPTHLCSSYWKGSLRVTIDYGRQLYYIYIYICVCVCVCVCVEWLVGFYSISTFLGYMQIEIFQTVLIQLIQLSINADFLYTFKYQNSSILNSSV